MKITKQEAGTIVRGTPGLKAPCREKPNALDVLQKIKSAEHKRQSASGSAELRNRDAIQALLHSVLKKTGDMLCLNREIQASRWKWNCNAIRCRERKHSARWSVFVVVDTVGREWSLSSFTVDELTTLCQAALADNHVR